MEEMVREAANRAASQGVGGAIGDNYFCLVVDFSKNGVGTVGAHGTGLFVPPNTLISYGIVRGESTANGTFSMKVLSTADLIESTANLAAEAIVDTEGRIVTGDAETEVVLTVSVRATQGKFVAWFPIFPLP